ncbi:dTDP-4-dehydrorhamnose reductase [Rheinheimera sp. FR7-31]|uniref:dTDP-4-dehydrorhamnose reductase n=1 Tax=Rheinheimera fenheensis TaxID=3152295 RepID=UPI00325E1262
MKLLLLGAGGQLGQAFCQSPFWRGNNSLALNHTQHDITDSKALKQLITEYQPDAVINCAAYTKVALAEQQAERCMHINADAVAQLAQLCAKAQCLLVQFSTDYVFNGEKGSAYVEADSTAPFNAYGQSKLLAEQAIQQHCQRYLIFRTSWLFSQYGHNFYRTMLALAQKGSGISVVNDETGCPTYAGDVANAVLQVLAQYNQSDKAQFSYGIYHLASAPAVSWHQFACAIFAAHQLTPVLTAVSSKKWADSVKRPAYSALNSQLFSTTFGVSLLSWQQALMCLADASNN